MNIYKCGQIFYFTLNIFPNKMDNLICCSIQIIKYTNPVLTENERFYSKIYSDFSIAKLFKKYLRQDVGFLVEYGPAKYVKLSCLFYSKKQPFVNMRFYAILLEKAS